MRKPVNERESRTFASVTRNLMKIKGNERVTENGPRARIRTRTLTYARARYLRTHIHIYNNIKDLRVIIGILLRSRSVTESHFGHGAVAHG